MKIKILLVIAICLGFNSYGQLDINETEVSLTKDAQPYANTITAEDLQKHLMILASDDYQGRETGTAGQKMAEAYIVNHFKELGMPEVNGSYTQEFELNIKDPSLVFVSANEKEYKFLDDFYYYPGGRDGVEELELVFAGYGINEGDYVEVEKGDVEGKAVLIFDGEPVDKKGNSRLTESPILTDWSKDPQKKIDLLKENGARAVFYASAGFKSNVARIKKFFARKSMSLSENKSGKNNDVIPVFYTSLEMGELLLGENKKLKKFKKLAFKKGPQKGNIGNTKIEFKRNSSKAVSSNVLGYIEGTDKKDELVVITAHYDHIGVNGEEINNGADDDGSGTVASLEIAEAFMKAKQEGVGPRRSVLIMTVSGEEKGLLGSKFYTDNPIFPLENTVADLNIDMIGRIDEQHEGNDNYIYLIGSDRLSADLHNLSEEVNKKCCGIELDYTYNDENDPNKFYYRSDHYNFAKNNIPVIFYFSGVHEDYHRPTDTPDKILYPKLANVTKLIFYTAWELANQDERIMLDGDPN